MEVTISATRRIIAGENQKWYAIDGQGRGPGQLVEHPIHPDDEAPPAHPDEHPDESRGWTDVAQHSASDWIAQGYLEGRYPARYICAGCYPGDETAEAVYADSAGITIRCDCGYEERISTDVLEESYREESH